MIVQYITWLRFAGKCRYSSARLGRTARRSKLIKAREKENRKTEALIRKVGERALSQREKNIIF
jgi:hypothetical protein